jgi:tetratricopeptide (TPR) repeat protein
MPGEIMRRCRSPQLLLAALACLSALPAHAEWRRASSAHFVVYGDVSERQIREYAQRLERYDSALRLITGQPETAATSHNRVEVYLLPSLSALRALYGRGGELIGGFYNSSFEGSRAFMPADTSSINLSAQTVMFHEYAHHMLLSSSTEFYPRWLSEGMAEFFMVTRLNRDGSAIIGLPNDERAYSLTAFSRMRASELLASDSRQLSRYDVDQLYASGWLMTHYLLLGGRRDGQLVRYVALLNRGSSWEDAAKEAFGDLGKLDQDLEAYRRTRTMKVFTIPADKLRTGEVEVATLPAGTAAIMPYRIRSARGVTKEMARELEAEAAPVAARHGDDAFVQRAMAEMHFDAGDDAAAEAAVDRALAIDPDLVAAMVYKGLVLADRAAKSAKAEDWAAARTWFIKANHADPDFALPLVLYYDSFGRAGERPGKAAVTAIMRAIELVPQSGAVRMRVGRQLVVENDLTLARRVLAPVLFSPHGDSDDALAEIARLFDEKAPPETILAAMDKAWSEDADD